MEKKLQKEVTLQAVLVQINDGFKKIDERFGSFEKRITADIENLAISTAQGFADVRAEAVDMEERLISKIDGLGRRIDDINFRKAGIVELKKLDVRLTHVEKKIKV